MEDLALEFRRGAQERRAGFRYSEELRQLAVEYARQAREKGHGRRWAAKRLGLSSACGFAAPERMKIGVGGLGRRPFSLGAMSPSLSLVLEGVRGTLDCRSFGKHAEQIRPQRPPWPMPAALLRRW